MTRVAYGARENLILAAVGESLAAHDAVTLKRVWTMRFEAPLFAVAFVDASVLPPSGDGLWRSAAVGDACAVVVDRSGTVCFVDLGSQRIITLIRGTRPPLATAATRRAFALGDASGTRIWCDGEELAFEGAVTALELVDDELALAHDGSIHVHSLPTRALRGSWHVGGHITAIARRPDGTWYAGNEHNLVALHEKPSRIHDGDVRRIVVDGKRFALQRTMAHVAVYAWDSFEPQLRLTGPVDGLAFMRGKLIALSASGILSEVDVRTGAKRVAES